MIFARNFVTLLIVSMSTMFLILFNSCNNESKSKGNALKEHMNDSTIGHVPIFVKRSKKVFVNEPVKHDNSPIFTANKYVVDVEQSELEWFCGKHTGFVYFKSGVLRVEKAMFSGGDFIINMDSIFNTDIDNNLMRGTLENIIKSNEIFDVEKFPETVFSIIQVKNEEGNEFSLSGSLNIKNVTKPLEFKTIIDINSDTLITKSEHFIIDRTEWGITSMSKKYTRSEDEFIVTDSISFIVHIKAIAKSD